MRLRSPLLSLLLLAAACAQALAAAPVYYDVPKGSHPHDVAADPAPGGPVYYTAQHAGKLGILDPKSAPPGASPCHVAAGAPKPRCAC